MIRWYVKTTAHSFLSVGLPMMVLYAEGSATMMNDTNSVFVLGSSPTVTGRTAVPAGETESPMNPISISVENLLMNWASGSSFPCVRPSSEATVGLGQELAMKLSSNSLANRSKDEMEDGFIRLYHIRAGPRSVMGKVRHISTSEVS
ncbi:hypothetical protein GW17_00061807 [Ensete ventricosum]|nr:hypothetical protein GW17_00061807 [Ensete ventricosum]